MHEIKERPILFSAPMVRAILDGRKTVTRRPLKLPHGFWETSVTGELVPIPVNCPYGKPGDRLYVRETFNRTNPGGAEGVYYYRADGEFPKSIGGGKFTDAESWKPSIHMPRAASRILLEITDVRVERLQDISEGQAVDEGLIWEGVKDGQTYWNHTDHRYPPGSHQQLSVSGTDAVSAFRNLWKSTGGDWEANPWVWVVEFKRVQP